MPASTYDTPGVTCTDDGKGNPDSISCKHKNATYQNGQSTCIIDESTQVVTCRPLPRTTADEMSNCQTDPNCKDPSGTCSLTCTPLQTTIYDDGAVSCVTLKDSSDAFTKAVCTAKSLPTQAPPVLNIVGMSAAAVQTYSVLMSIFTFFMCVVSVLFVFCYTVPDENIGLKDGTRKWWMWAMAAFLVAVFLETTIVTGYFWNKEEQTEPLAYSFIPAITAAFLVFVAVLLKDKIPAPIAESLITKSPVWTTLGGVAFAVMILTTFFMIAEFTK